MGLPTESSPLVGGYAPRSVHGAAAKSGVTWAETALKAKNEPPPENEDYHRCYRSYGSKPFFMASIAIGAGSFAQGCGSHFLRRQKATCSHHSSYFYVPARLRK